MEVKGKVLPRVTEEINFFFLHVLFFCGKKKTRATCKKIKFYYHLNCRGRNKHIPHGVFAGLSLFLWLLLLRFRSLLWERRGEGMLSRELILDLGHTSLPFSLLFHEELLGKEEENVILNLHDVC